MGNGLRKIGYGPFGFEYLWKKPRRFVWTVAFQIHSNYYDLLMKSQLYPLFRINVLQFVMNKALDKYKQKMNSFFIFALFRLTDTFWWKCMKSSNGEKTVDDRNLITTIAIIIVIVYLTMCDFIGNSKWFSGIFLQCIRLLSNTNDGFHSKRKWFWIDNKILFSTFSLHSSAEHTILKLMQFIVNFNCLISKEKNKIKCIRAFIHTKIANIKQC